MRSAGAYSPALSALCSEDLGGIAARAVAPDFRAIARRYLAAFDGSSRSEAGSCSGSVYTQPFALRSLHPGRIGTILPDLLGAYVLLIALPLHPQYSIFCSRTQ